MNHGYQAGDYVYIGKGERGMILSYAGRDCYRVMTPRGEVTTHVMFLDGAR